MVDGFFFSFFLFFFGQPEASKPISEQAVMQNLQTCMVAKNSGLTWQWVWGKRCGAAQSFQTLLTCCAQSKQIIAESKLKLSQRIELLEARCQLAYVPHSPIITQCHIVYVWSTALEEDCKKSNTWWAGEEVDVIFRSFLGGILERFPAKSRKKKAWVSLVCILQAWCQVLEMAAQPSFKPRWNGSHRAAKWMCRGALKLRNRCCKEVRSTRPDVELQKQLTWEKFEPKEMDCGESVPVAFPQKDKWKCMSGCTRG